MATLAERVRRRCAEELYPQRRGMAGCRWLYDAFLATPREHFVPDRVWWPERGKNGYRLYDRAMEPRAWLSAVYTPGYSLITQIDDGAVAPTGPAEGRFTSSISASCTIVELLRHLAPEPGERVLEIGTGTGYTTALLTHRTGPGTVVSVEIDPRIAAHASRRLGELGVDVRLVTGDGEHGHAGSAPYDRVVSTASVRRIPEAWVRQLRPGGVLLTPLDSPFGHDLLVLLVADGRGNAVGRAVAEVEFMRVRGQRLPVPHRDLGWPEPVERGQWRELAFSAGRQGQHVDLGTTEGGRPRTRL
ncbi:methyltransferase domain-containing protein [Streptomyces monticola]|uniref:Protein-L-isoaspartate O-methyltransferase n=1 Tax=Streptomyces monticola TaxID=2666263 RepID=A0ABW2JE86_9ACTN